MNDVSTYAAVIVAAGSSSRLGSPKQQVQAGAHTLLDHIISVANKSRLNHVITVINKQLEKQFSGIHLSHVVVNEHPSNGVASSIKVGLQYLLNLYPAISGTIILVCDQPFVEKDLLNEIINTHEQTGKPLVAAAYADTIGTPAFFHRSFFDLLLSLNGDNGAKKILLSYPQQLVTVDFPKGSIDIDTPEDLEKWKAFYQ